MVNGYIFNNKEIVFSIRKWGYMGLLGKLLGGVNVFMLAGGCVCIGGCVRMYVYRSFSFS